MPDQTVEARFFRHRKRPEWGLGRLLVEQPDRVTLAFEDDVTRVILKRADGLQELDATDRRLLDAIRAELATHGTLCPPWLKYPSIPRGSISWRMGSGEWYVWMLSEWTTGWSPEQHVAHLRRYAPVPLIWSNRIAGRLGVGDPVAEPEARAKLASHGLLERHADAIDRAFDDREPPSQERLLEAQQEGGKRHGHLALCVALTGADGEYATRYCLRALAAEDDFIRSCAALALGHIARRHGHLDQQLARPALERALRDQGRYVAFQAAAAAHDIAYHAGWRPDPVAA